LSATRPPRGSTLDSVAGRVGTVDAAGEPHIDRSHRDLAPVGFRQAVLARLARPTRHGRGRIPLLPDRVSGDLARTRGRRQGRRPDRRPAGALGRVVGNRASDRRRSRLRRLCALALRGGRARREARDRGRGAERLEAALTSRPRPLLRVFVRHDRRAPHRLAFGLEQRKGADCESARLAGGTLAHRRLRSGPHLLGNRQRVPRGDEEVQGRPPHRRDVGARGDVGHQDRRRRLPGESCCLLARRHLFDPGLGPLLLGIVAAGLFAYSVFYFVRAAYREV
jgi:hypothetical protein